LFKRHYRRRELLELIAEDIARHHKIVQFTPKGKIITEPCFYAGAEKSPAIRALSRGL